MSANSTQMSLPWKTVAVTSAVIALTSLCVAAVVSSTNNADALSVVALGLAVLAFIIQIIVYIVQAQAASQQQLQAQEVYGSTLKALAAIEEKTEGTRQTVTTINERMLEAFLGKAIPQAQDAGLSPTSPDFYRIVAERVSEYLQLNREVASDRRQTRTEAPASSSAYRRARRARRTELPADSSIAQFPDREELDKALRLIDDLSIHDLDKIKRLGLDHARYEKDSDVTPGVDLYTGAKKLYDRKLVRRYKPTWSDRPVFALTPEGVLVARLILAPSIPEWAPDRAREVREQLAEQERQLFEEINKDRYPDIPVE
ncbi:hypothetical protein ACWCOT_20230 [Nonomuraea bangladeshensis]